MLRYTGLALFLISLTTTLPSAPGDEPPQSLLRKERASFRVEHRVRALAFSPDAKWLAAATDHSVLLWEVEPAALRAAVDIRVGFGAALAFSSDGRSVAVTATERRVVHLCDVPGRRLRRSLEIPAKAESFALAYVPRPEMLAVAGHEDGGYHVLLCDPETGRVVDRLPAKGAALTEVVGKSRINFIAVSPDGGLLAVGTDEGGALWELPNRHLRFQWRSKLPIPLAFAPDGGTLIACGQALHFFDTATGREQAVVEDKDCRDFTSLSVVPDGRSVLAAVSTGNHKLPGRIVVFSLPDHKRVANYVVHEREAAHSALSIDGKLLATCGYDYTVKLWDAALFTGSK